MLEYKKFTCDECEAIIYVKTIPYKKIIKILSYVGNKETGGVLIGRYSSSLRQVYINEFSNAPEDSKSGFSWFVRGVKGLSEYLKRKWYVNDEYYLGEWHFHPANNPDPSLVDIQQLKSIANDQRFNCKEPILVIFSRNNDDYNLTVKLFIKSLVYSFRETIE